jgi:glycosyltransferase 2 family protein
MSNVTSALAAAMRGKSALSFVAGVVSLAIVAAAAVTLFKLLHEIDFAAVVAAAERQSPDRLLAAALCVVAGYAMLACYDVFALHLVGRKAIPCRVAAFASFTSYTIGHNLGGTVFTSGLIRYRIYSAWGLNAVDIARIAFVTSLTYCLGNALVLGYGAAQAPAAASAIDHLPATINRAAGVAALAALAGYVLWLSFGPRVVGRADWQVRFPGPRLALIQIGIGSLDLTFVSLAMYVLLPARPVIDVVDLMVIFVTAMLVGVVSYVPGSLGVMEAAVFVGLPQFRREELLASLLTFRVIYFVIPLCLAAFLLCLREFYRIVSGLGRAC